MLRAYLHILPYAFARQEHDIERLIGVLLRLVYLVDKRLRFLLVYISNDGINLQTSVFLAKTVAFIVECDSYIVAVVYVLVVLVLCAHLAPYAVRSSVIHLHIHLHTLARKQFLQIAAEDVKPRLVGLHVVLQGCLYRFIFMRTTVFERQVLKICLYVEESEAVGQRSVEIVRLAGDLHLLVGSHRCQRAHIVQAVGDLYH